MLMTGLTPAGEQKQILILTTHVYCVLITFINSLFRRDFLPSGFFVFFQCCTHKGFTNVNHVSGSGGQLSENNPFLGVKIVTE